jgi:hypothetical protein
MSLPYFFFNDAVAVKPSNDTQDLLALFFNGDDVGFSIAIII